MNTFSYVNILYKCLGKAKAKEAILDYVLNNLSEETLDGIAKEIMISDDVLSEHDALKLTKGV